MNDRDIFNFLAVHLPDGKGLILGAVRNPRHYSGFLNYGFTLTSIPRKPALYTYETNVIAHYIDERFHKTFQIGDCFPEDYTPVLKSSSLFCDEVFRAFLNFERHIIDLPKKETVQLACK